MSADLGIIVLAAGHGTRMKSALPKVLHPVAGVPMVAHVIAAGRSLAPSRLAVVVGHGGERVRAAIADEGIAFVEQDELLGTADAVRRCQQAMSGCERVLVLNGDEPLVTTATLLRLLAAGGGAPMAFVSQQVTERGALGRVVRDGAGRVVEIAQSSDEPGTGGPAEINWGEYLFEGAWLWDALARVQLSPKGEYYLTELAAIASAAGRPAVTIAADPEESLGVDDRVKLAEAERRMRSRLLRGHMLAGVTIIDPATTYIDAQVALEADVTIHPNCALSGQTSVAGGAVIGPGTTLHAAHIGARTTVRQSAIEDSWIGEDVGVGPFAHVRGGSRIGDGCYLGNYAEVNRSVLERGVKMHHFSYLGDADVGEGANIAAGMITCNYDGVSKHRTTIGAGAFIGCDTMLVAPVTVGAGAVTGAGSVVRHDVPAGGRVAGVPARDIGRAGGE